MKKIACASLALTFVVSISAQEHVSPPAKQKMLKVAAPAQAPLAPLAPLGEITEVSPAPHAPAAPPVTALDPLGELPPATEAPMAPPKDDESLPEDYKAFLKRNPSIRNVGWNKEEVIIRLKSGKEERYLRTEKSIKEAEDKYGKLPDAPPPPPSLPAKSKQ